VGRHSVQLILSMIDDSVAERHIVVAAGLIDRESTTSPASHH
jgi:hypothetical protein